jgi:type VI secretion system secreted protein Hcp
MAETVHLFLKVNGTDIQGESTQTSLGRENSIECLSFEFRVASPVSTSGSGMATGRRRYDPIKVQKRIDKSSPLLLRAFTLNEKIDAVFQFYRPNPTGDGTTEQFYTVEIRNGRIVGVAQYVHEIFRPETANDPPLEEVSFVFNTIIWTYTNGGVTHEDSWSAIR